jgi:hypothetical protein
MARFLRTTAAPAYTPERVDTLIGLPGADTALEGAGPEAARRWLDLIATRPDLYVRIRLADFGQVLATPRPMACRPLFVGLDGPPDMVKALDLAPRDQAKDAWARRYSLAFVGTPVLSHLSYAALAVLLMVLAVRDLTRSPAPPDRIVVIAILGSALSFAASFFFVAVACDYRYLYFLDLAVMGCLAHRAAAGWRRRADP